MTTALGDECITKKLFSDELGSATKPIDTAYITNIVPPPGGGATPTLQQVCDTGNSTTTGLNVDGDYGSTNGDITTTNGNIDATTGIVSGASMVAQTEYFTINGDFRTTNGRVLTPQINTNQATDTLHIVGKVGIGVNPADPITEDLEVNGNIQSKGYIGDTGQCAFKFRRVPLTSYLTASTTGTGTINTATTMGVDDWNLSYTVRSSGSINQLNLRITKPLPTGVPVFGNCRPKVFLSNSGTTPRPATYAVCDSAGSNDFQITVVWSSAIPNGDSGYVWLEIDQLL